MLVLATALLLLVSGSVAAADTTAPTLVIPEDVPGADVIVFLGDSYTFDASSSTDDTGIVDYLFEFWDGTTQISKRTVTGQYTYTFLNYGQTWVKVIARDAAANEAEGWFSIDVAELMTTDLVIQDTTYTVDHSIYLQDADLKVDNSRVEFADGAGQAKDVVPGVPDTLAENMFNTDGPLAGHWQPYYEYSYSGQNFYGKVVEDTEYVLSGEKSIRLDAGSYTYKYGFEYQFDNPTDITGYGAISWWIHSNFLYYGNINDNNRIAMYYLYFYGGSQGTYNYPYAYSMAGTYMQGGSSAYHGWHGYTMPLDAEKIGRWYVYNYYGPKTTSVEEAVDSVLSKVHTIRFYMLSQYDPSGQYSIWIDNVGLYDPEWSDEITESVSPSGDMAGDWSATYGATTQTSESYLGSASVGARLRKGTSTSNSYRNEISYRFDDPQDMAGYSSLRYFSTMRSYSNFYPVNYAYYWHYYSYSPQYWLYAYDSSGHTAYFRGNYYTYLAYMYSYVYQYPNSPSSYYRYGDWYANSLPWGAEQAEYDNGVDWSSISSFKIVIDSFYYYYSNPSSSESYVWYLIDGVEWYRPSSVTYKAPDNVPLAIYVDGGDTSITGHSTIIGTGKVGARIVTEGGTATLKSSTFDNMWATNAPCVNNGAQVFGGVEVYGDAVIDNVDFRNCPGPGLALFDGTWNCDQDSIDLSGAATKIAGSPRIIFGVSDRTTGAISIDITGWTLEDNTMGPGIMFMVDDTSASIDLTISGVSVDRNMVGILISNMGGISASPTVQGGTGDLDVTIKDQVIEDSEIYGIVYYAGDGGYAPAIWASLTVDNVTVRNSGEDGMLVWLDSGYTNLNALYTDSIFRDNTGSGIYHYFTGFFGAADIEMHNITSESNSGSGLETVSVMQPYDDGSGNVISPIANVDMLVNASFLRDNDGWGFVDRLNGDEDPDGGVAPPWAWTGPTRTTLWYNVTMQYSELANNAAGGFKSTPDNGWSHADLVATHEVIDCNLIENRGPGVYLEPNHDMSGGGGTVSDVYKFMNSRINDNGEGVVQNLGHGNRGYYSEVYLSECQLVDNNDNSIDVYGTWSTDGIYRWGLSMVRGAMFSVDACTINSPASFYLEGADDSGGPDWEATMGVSFTNNNVDLDSDAIPFVLSAYPYCQEFVAKGDISGNRFLRGFPADGYNVMLYGGWNLDMDFAIHDERIRKALGSGISVVAGTLAQSTSPHQVFGTFTIDNVTIDNPGANGVNFTVVHRSIVGGSSRGVLMMRDVTIDGVATGIFAKYVDGLVYDSVIKNNEAAAVSIKSAVFDFFSCDVGSVDNTNIQVLTKGAARMWFDVDVDVKWASGAHVMGAVVSMQDNTWATIAVDTVDQSQALSMGYVNSYTILPDSVYSKSPFLISATYLGLITKETVDVNGDMVIDLILVDDVIPRLTVNEPMDGVKQRETSLAVKGSAWDMHSGLDKILVSIDDFDWYEATGAPAFEYTFDTVPEGNLLLRVKAIDYAGNEQLRFISVLVDATAPPIVIIEPKDDVFTTNEGTLTIVGITEIGASVFVNNDLIDMDHTLFSTTIGLVEGLNEVRVMAMDRLGNWDVHVIMVTLDTIAPPIIVTSPAPDTVVGEETVDVTGQTEAMASVYIDGQIVSNLNGLFSGTAQLTPGPNVIVVMAEDAVGNQRVVTVPITSDTKAPWLQLASPLEGEVFGFPGIVVRGWVEGGSTVHVNDQPVDVTNGFFSTSVLGSEGENAIFVTVTDQAGNSYTENVDAWFDTTPPTIILVTPMDGEITSEDSVEVSGKLLWDEREGFRDISLQISGEFAPFAADGEFLVHYDLVEGTNPLIIVATDDVGNANGITVVVVRDSKAPFLLVQAVPTFNHPLWNKAATYNALVYIDGMTEPGTMVTVDGSNVIVDDTGHFNVSILLDPVPEDSELIQRTVTVIATDEAGNYVEETIDIYRLQKEEEDPGFSGYETAQYWVMFLSIVILVVAIVAAAFLWRRVGMEDEEEYYDDYDSEEV